MDDRDAAVWDRWLLKHAGEQFRCQYDVPVGSGRPAMEIDDVAGRSLWQQLTVKRVDVVVDWSSGVWVVEVKPELNMSGLGQVLGYVHLYRRDNPGVEPVTAVLVCGKTDSELEEVYARNQIIVEIV